VNAWTRGRAADPASWQNDDAERAERDLCNLRWEGIVAEDALVAYAAAWEVRRRRFRFDLVVHPEERRQGLGASLFDTVLAAARRYGGETIQARADSTDFASLGFLERRDFREVQRMVAMERDLTADDATAVVPVAAGVEILTAAEGERLDPTFWLRLHAAHVRAAQDWPDPQPSLPREAISIDQFLRLLSLHGIPPTQLFVANVSGTWVAYSGVAAHPGDPRTACTGPTAVDPSYRGRGIATVLKATTLAWAARTGFLRVESRSASPALQRVNEKLGLGFQAAEVRLVRRAVEDQGVKP
jgi:GNAT superfamily N-acetyltransferase